MAITSFKPVIVGVLALAGVAGIFLIQHQSLVRVREENAALRQQIAEYSQEIARTMAVSNTAGQVRAIAPLSGEELSELLRLRGEVGRLRQESKQAEKLRQENAELRAAASRELAKPENPPSGISPVPQPLVVRTFRVNAPALLQRIGADSSTSPAEANDSLRRFFKDNGVELGPPAAVFLNYTQGSITARATAEQLEMIERLIAGFIPNATQQGVVSQLGSDGSSQNLNAVAEVVQEARALFEAGKLDEAEVRLRNAVRNDPNNQAAYYYLNVVANARRNATNSLSPETGPGRQ